MAVPNDIKIITIAIGLILLLSSSYAGNMMTFVQNQKWTLSNSSQLLTKSALATNNTLHTNQSSLTGVIKPQTITLTTSAKHNAASNLVTPLSKKNIILRENALKEANPQISQYQISNKSIIGPRIGSATDINITEVNNASYLGYNPLKKTSTQRVSGDTFRVFANYSNMPIPNDTLYLPTEPAVGNAGKLVFYVGTFFAARSNNGGQTWNYTDLNSKMPFVCCDQEVIYEAHHHMFIWSMMDIPQNDTSGGKNNLTLAISHDANNWYLYNISSILFDNNWRHQVLDSPQIAISNGHVYITANRFSHFYESSRHLEGTIIARMNLGLLSNGSSNSLQFVEEHNLQNPSFGPVQGATDRMYWATHVFTNPLTSLMRIYVWPENSRFFNWIDIAIPAWTHLPHGVDFLCPSPDGHNWCVRSDTRITSGWIMNGLIGFIWNVPAGNGFPYPYVNAAVFKINNLRYLGDPYLYSLHNAWMYAYVSPNPSGLGIVAAYGGHSLYPSMAAGIRNTFTGGPRPWDMHAIVTGTNGPHPPDGLGDFSWARPYSGLGPVWVAAGYTLQGGSTPEFVKPFYFVFGLGDNTNIQQLNLNLLPKMQISMKIVQIPKIAQNHIMKGN